MNEEHKAKAKEIYEVIKSQPPQVIAYLADFYGRDDGEPMCAGCIDDVLQDALGNGDFEDNRNQKRYIIKAGMCLPDIEIDLQVFTEAEKQTRQADDDYEWNYSTQSKVQEEK